MIDEGLVFVPMSADRATEMGFQYVTKAEILQSQFVKEYIQQGLDKALDAHQRLQSLESSKLREETSNGGQTPTL